MKILFLCSANSARSIMAEALCRQFASAEIEVSSAGTDPTKPEPAALEALQSMGIATDGLKSKALDEFADTEFDYVISLCDRARTECQADFSGQNFIAWDFLDPVASRARDAFRKTAQELSERIRMFLLILSKSSTAPHLYNAPQEFFKVMADPLRLQLIVHTAQGGEVCVCDFVSLTGMSQPKVSRHLAQLREYGVLLDRKQGRWVYYRLNPALPDWMAKIIQLTLSHNPQLIEAQQNECV
ncbi:metalloregulator ArsR/SmtB family transcription factor [Pseudidiomarina terrestris]|uniref:metalloregulator ArsR/SmtB family transcription factor n=1 Tax=Pseudidiomarina terrestris TaxID=2820060 RepID=UPI002651051A|nr:metalloregulator ArsR/SmtB family transcription factor [Pseudidiomarina sp. 1ASP75-5]MDN7135941.1 metalloregulator ArsR/SmtB family transcription factor [Pseudidiomarina sp. 1ASP75-5]